MRRYHAEYLYLVRPDSHNRIENMDILSREQIRFDQEVNASYAELLAYAPPARPLWKNRNGYSTRSREETHKVIIEIATTSEMSNVLMFVLNCLLIYRAPSLIMQVWRRPHARRDILLDTLKQYALDFLAIVGMLLVYLAAYRSLELTSDLFVDLVEKKSWKVCLRYVQ